MDGGYREQYERMRRTVNQFISLSIDFIEERISKLEMKIDSLNSLISNYKISNGVCIAVNPKTASALINIDDH